MPDLVVGRAYRGTDTTHGFESMQDCMQHLLRVDTEFLTQRQDCWYHDTTRMGHRSAVQVIGFGNVGQCAH